MFGDHSLFLLAVVSVYWKDELMDPSKPFVAEDRSKMPISRWRWTSDPCLYHVTRGNSLPPTIKGSGLDFRNSNMLIEDCFPVESTKVSKSLFSQDGGCSEQVEQRRGMHLYIYISLSRTHSHVQPSLAS